MTQIKLLDSGKNNNFTDRTLIKIGHNLRILNCNENGNISDISVGYLRNLEILHCGNNMSAISDYGLIQIKNTLKELYRKWNSKLTDNSIIHAKKLKVSDCGYNVNFIDSALENKHHLEKLYRDRNTEKLKVLDCGINHNFTDDSIKKLKYLTTLFSGNDMRLSDKSLKKLKSLRELSCLRMKILRILVWEN